MLSYQFDPIRGSSRITFACGSNAEPPLDPPEENEDDYSSNADCDEDGCLLDFTVSVEPD
jgi:hypothetical protein